MPRERLHCKTFVRCVVTFGLALASVSSVAAQTDTRRTGEWLVDLARDYAMSPMVSGRNEDAEIILSYLEAAARVDPSHPDAYLWQYDMLTALGRQREAVLALTRYSELRPEDVSARLKTIQLRLGLLQTLELRRAFCEDGLAQPKLPPLVKAELSYQLALIYFAQLDDERGDAALDRALEACPEHVAARMLREERARPAGEGPSPIDGMLASLALNPLQPDVIWSVAQQLDAAGLHHDAITWFERALKLFPVSDASFQASAAMRIEVAAAYLSAGRPTDAMQACQQAIDAEPRAVNARLMMLHIARELSRGDLAAEQIARIRQVYDDLAPMIEAAKAGRSAAEIALFYAWYDPQPEKAKHWIDLAESYEPGLPLTQIATGLLALTEHRNADAIEKLEPQAADNQTAALGLADALIASDRQDDAVQVLRAAAARLRTGPIYALLVKRLASLGQSMDESPAGPAMARALKAFDDGVFALAEDPSAVLSIEGWMANATPRFGEPWRCVVRIKNTGQRPVHLGAAGLLSPQILVSIEIAGDRTLSLPAYLWMSADWMPVLSPGESVEVSQTIDVGPLRHFLDACPQARLDASVNLIVDAVPDASGAWVPSRAGRALPPIRVTREALKPDDGLLSRLFAGVSDSDPTARIVSGCALVGLLAEQQMAKGRAPGYARASIDDDRAMSVVLSLVRQDSSPHVRARVLDALRSYSLGPRELPVVAGLLSDRSWLVRLLAVATLGEQQGRAFLPVLRGIGQNDPDRLLRQFCVSYATVSQPASSGNPRPQASKGDTPPVGSP